MRNSSLALALALGGMTVAASAQQTLDFPVSELVPYQVPSGLQLNNGDHAAVVFDHVVQMPDVAWLRVHFDQVRLAPGSFVRITSLADGEVQELDSAGLAMWQYGSAYFNGDAVRVELVASPGSFDNGLTISQIERPIDFQQVGGGGECGICGGSDDRQPSTELWAARLFPAGCSASVYSTDSCMVTAGHCVGGGMVVQFNVPPSSCPSGNPVNPPVADQFPASILDVDSNGPGDDWAVLSTGNNNMGQKPYERYGVLREIATEAASAGQTVSLTGYGTDTTCSQNLAQRTSDGPVCGVFPDAYTYSVDLTGGNSGSALLRNDQIIGIVTHCPCCNVATRIDNPDVANAIDTLCPASETATTTLPFFDDIPDVELDQALWSGIDGAESSTRGANEPSPDRSLNLDSTNLGGDVARTAIMDTSALTALRVVYWYEQTGNDDPPEAGDDLVVEFIDADGLWNEVRRHLGSGPDMTEYEYNAIVMPPEALHSDFRLRFRAITDDSGGDDDHFVDDICIGAPEDCGGCDWDLSGDNVVSTNDLLLLLASWGANPGGPPDFDGDGTVGTSDLLELLSNWGQCGP